TARAIGSSSRMDGYGVAAYRLWRCTVERPVIVGTWPGAQNVMTSSCRDENSPFAAVPPRRWYCACTVCRPALSPSTSMNWNAFTAFARPLADWLANATDWNDCGATDDAPLTWKLIDSRLISSLGRNICAPT